MFRIGEFSKMSKTTIKALRYYDETGLLKPEHIDPITNYRFYTTRQLVTVHRILSLRQVGLSIDEIRLVLSGQHPEELLMRRRTELLEELSERNDQLSRIDFMLQYKEDSFMSYVATIKQIPECIIYTKQLTVPGIDSYFQVIPAIGEQMKEKYPDLQCTVPGYCYIQYLDGEYREKDIRIEWCEAVTEMKPDFDDIVFRKSPAITALSVMHKGPYSSLREAYAFALKWNEDNGYQMTDLARECYIDGIWNKDDENEWLTELQFPIAKK